MSDAATLAAGPASGTPPAGAVPPAGASGTPGAAAPAAGAAFTWDPGLEAPIVDLLKAKGVYDDPVVGIPKLARSYYDANKALSGGDVAVVPADWTNKEAVDKYLGKVRGVTKPEEYVPTFGEGVTPNAPFVAFAQKLAFDWGVPKARFQQGIDAYQQFALEMNKNFEAATAKANDDAITALKNKQGEAVFNANVANAQTVFKTLSAKGLISRDTLVALEGAVGSAAVVELLSAIGGSMKQEAGVMGNGSGAPPVDPTQMTPEQAKTEIAKLNGDADFQKVYLSKSPADKAAHDIAVKRMADLYAAVARRPG